MAAIGFSVALLARIWPFVFHVFRPGQLYLYGDSDAYYHLRRIRLAAAHFPAVPDFDPWLDYPHGAYTIWAPLFDWLPAGLATVLGADPELVAVLWPALLGAASAVVLQRVLRPTVGDPAALSAALLFALLPGAVLNGALGHVDHHVAEVLLQLLTHLQLVHLLLRIERGERPTLRAVLAFGVIMGLALLTWAGSLLFMCVPCAVLCVLSLQAGPRAAELTRVARVGFGCAAAIALPYAWLNLTRGRPAFASVFVSMLHIALCLVMAFAPTLVAAAARAFRTLSLARAAARLGLATGAAALPLLLPGVRHGLLDGLAFVSRDQDPWLRTIAEFQPPLASAAAWDASVAYAGYGVPYLALTIAVFAWRAAHEGLRRGVTWLWLFWSAHALALALAQLRFHTYAEPLIAATPVLLLHAASAAYAQASARRLLGVLALGALLCTLPALGYFQPLLSGDPSRHVAYPQLRFPVFDLLRRMREQTPSAGDPYDLDTKPAYGVLAPWDLGHALISIAERPAVSTPFGTHLSGQGYRDVERFFEVLLDEASTVRMLQDRNCRYVITSATTGPGAARSFARALHATDGSTQSDFAGTGRYRRRLSTIGLSIQGQPGYKLFELVPGALLRFEAVNASELWLQAQVEADAGSFLYRRRATRAEDGSHAVRVAHPGRYRVLGGGRELGVISVSEREVMQGRTLTLRPAGPA